MRILTLDPGLINFAYCLAEVREPISVSPPTVLETGKFKTNLVDKSDVNSIKEFASAMAGFMQKSGLASHDFVFVERYTSRGGFGGPKRFQGGSANVEPINLMIGVTCATAVNRGCVLRMEPAATWKRWCNDRALHIPEEPRRSRRFATNVHERDTVGMLLYLWSSGVLGTVDRRVAKRTKHVCTEAREAGRYY